MTAPPGGSGRPRPGAGDPFTASAIGPTDLHLFAEGTHRNLAAKLGAHPRRRGGRATRFSLWAPNARWVAVIGDFNGWDHHRDRLAPVESSGIWTGVVAGVGVGERYKYALEGADGAVSERADPVGLATEVPPRTASVVADLDYSWGDAAWMAGRGALIAPDTPVSIYEVHLGSFWRDPARPERLASYQELAPRLVEHLKAGGFTHLELLPLMEHPFYGSWGYQTTGYFAPSARYGSPQDVMALVDQCHQAGLGVILDWVPSHFPFDPFALARFDGTHLYEHADPRQGYHPDWNSAIFNYGRREVRSFLLSSAHHWLEAYHADGLRVDAVASMLYLDYSRREGEWVPNRYGGRENLEAIDFLRDLTTGIGAAHPDVATFAEESTAWPGVTRPVAEGGLGFTYKWDMGWMHDTLSYMGRDPVHRRYHHGEVTFRALYWTSESYVLPLSHDEVVHGKGSLLAKMPGDDWQKRANLRLLLAYQFALPGKKLLFMGDEIGQWAEWSHDAGVDWALLDDPAHAGIQRLVADLNRCYRDVPALHQGDCDPSGFSWLDPGDAEGSTLAFLRHGTAGAPMVVLANFTPVVRPGTRVAVPQPGTWEEILNTDATAYGGSGVGNLGAVEAEPRGATLSVTLPPLGALYLVPARPGSRPAGEHAER